MTEFISFGPDSEQEVSGKAAILPPEITVKLKEGEVASITYVADTDGERVRYVIGGMCFFVPEVAYQKFAAARARGEAVTLGGKIPLTAERLEEIQPEVMTCVEQSLQIAASGLFKGAIQSARFQEKQKRY